MKKTISDYIVIFFTIVGGIIAIITFYDYYYTNLSGEGKWAVIFLGTFSSYYLSYNIYLISKNRKKIRYNNAFRYFNVGFADIHAIDRVHTPDKRFILEKFISSCNSISNAFSYVNGHHIGVCLKIIAEEEGQATVRTYCRDHISSMARKWSKTDRTVHWISGNSDFWFILNNLKNHNTDLNYFFSDKLPFERNYLNTRLEEWPPKSYFIKIPLLRLLYLNKEWPLLYRSTIVVPLVPYSANDQHEKALRGFLCIDSPYNRVFYKKLDIEILKGLADGLYNKIDKLYDLIKDENEHNK